MGKKVKEKEGRQLEVCKVFVKGVIKESIAVGRVEGMEKR